MVDHLATAQPWDGQTLNAYECVGGPAAGQWLTFPERTTGVYALQLVVVPAAGMLVHSDLYPDALAPQAPVHVYVYDGRIQKFVYQGSR